MKCCKLLMGRLKKIHTIDWCLIIFMIILLIQSGFNVMVNETVTQETNSIDIIVRTSAASIFGYFISGNFLDRGKKKNKKNENVQSVSALSVDVENSNMEGVEDDCEMEQIVIVSVIGIFSLIVLLFCRNFAEVTQYKIGTLSQLRDFVSGCVGFLIGSAKK